MRLTFTSITVPPGVDPAIVAAADTAMTFDFDAEKLIKLAVDSRLPAYDAVKLITASDDMATLDDSTEDVARIGFDLTRTHSTDDVVDVMDAVGDAATMDDATIEALELSARAMSTWSTSNVVAAIERADRSSTMDADLLVALRTEFNA